MRDLFKPKKIPKDVDVCPECRSTNITVCFTRNEGTGRRRTRRCNKCGCHYGTVEIFTSEYVEMERRYAGV